MYSKKQNKTGFNMKAVEKTHTHSFSVYNFYQKHVVYILEDTKEILKKKL